MIDPTRPLPRLARLLGMAALLGVGVAPLPGSWTAARSVRDAARTADLDPSERQVEAGGYYQGLIGGGGDAVQGARDDLALRLLGRPTEWVRFHAADVTERCEGTFIQFELKANLDRPLFGRRFTTNSDGMRDRHYPRAKPEGTFRVALLGSSMDMGWGVATDETYEQRLEHWLNAHAARVGVARRFEVLNFAVAAYAPAQRVESLRLKAAAFDPDLVLYSATMLDGRLAEIHLHDLLRERVDPRDDYLQRVAADAGLTESDLRLDAEGNFVRKDVVKAKLRPHQWALIDGSMGLLAADCRSLGMPLACLIVPRVGQADSPDARASAVARHAGIAARHAIPLIDLSATYDRLDPTTLEIAPWDDHPNALGHERLFLGLARALVRDPALYREFFGVAPQPRPTP